MVNKLVLINIIVLLMGTLGALTPVAAEIEAKILTVYLSRTGNTKAVAGIIHKQVGGDQHAIQLKTPYPEDYNAIVEQVRKENETGYLPPLKPANTNIEGYDTVFIGFPTWGMQLPPPVKSFLHSYDLSGKSVYPFNTNAGYGLGSSIKTLKEMCTGCEVKASFSVKGGIERDGVMLAIKNARRENVEEEVRLWLKETFEGPMSPVTKNDTTAFAVELVQSYQ